MKKNDWKKEVSKKVALPEENVEYTFIFPGNKFITYTFCGLNEKGRLVLYNVKQKTFSTMSPGWFNSLIGKRRQLVSKKSIMDKQKEQETKRPQGIKLIWKEETYEERSIRELRELTPAQAFSVNTKIGYPADVLADELEKIFADKTGELYSNEYVSRVFGNLMRAQTIIATLNNKAVNNLCL